MGLGRPAGDGARVLVGAVCVVLVAALAAALAFCQVTRTAMLHEERVRFAMYLDGTVHKPFAYRILVPLGIRVMTGVLSPSLTTALDRRLGELASGWRDRSVGAIALQALDTPTRPLHAAAVAVVLWLSLLGYAAMSALAYRALFDADGWPRALVPVSVLVALIPFVARGSGQLYDFTALMFMAGLLYAMAAHRHGLFLVLFAVACLNKETTVFMTLAYAACFRDTLPRRDLLRNVGLQGVIFALVYGGARYYFADNPGSGMESWWVHQISWLMRRTFADLVTFALIVALLTFQWRQKPLLLRRASVILIPHVALFVVGAPGGEFRALYESVPLLSLLAFRNLELLGRGWLTGGLDRPRDTHA